MPSCTNNGCAPLAGRAIYLWRCDRSGIFNNNHEDQGQRNAQTLMEILGAMAIQPSLGFDDELPL